MGGPWSSAVCVPPAKQPPARLHLPPPIPPGWSPSRVPIGSCECLGCREPVFGEGNQLLKFAQETAFQPQLPGSRTRQRRDRGASHHGELAARRPGTPDPGMGREARAPGTHLGRAAEAGSGEGGRRSRHVASPDFLPLFLHPGWGRGSGGPRKTFFQVAFGVAKLFEAGWLWLPAVGSWGDPRSGARPPGRGWASISPGWEGRSGRPRHRRHGPRSSPAARQRRSCPPGIRAPAGATRPHKGSGAPGRASTWRWAGGCGRGCLGAAESRAGLSSPARRPGGSLHQKGRVNTTLPFLQVRGGWHFSGVQQTVRRGGSRVFCSFSFGTWEIDGSGWLFF